uniref:UPAR/Ly6 domain-containing protein n=1 Tax=Megaselia scalaris TaxID=36166 RepID=T1GH25_MEGSC
MFSNLLLLLVICLGFSDVYGLTCNNCADVNSCKNPETLECNITEATQSYQKFAIYFNETNYNKSLTCFTANISLETPIGVSILALGCGFSNFNLTPKNGINLISNSSYEECDSDNCNTFSSIATTPNPTTSNSSQTACDLSNSIPIYNQLMPYLNMGQMISNQYECIALNGNFSLSSKSEEIIYEGCVPKGIDICGSNGKDNTLSSYTCKSCETNLCNNLNASIESPNNKINCYTCDSEPCGNRNSIQCSENDVFNTYRTLSPGYNFTANSSSTSFECITLNATVSANGTDKNIFYKGCAFSNVDMCDPHYLTQGYTLKDSDNCTQCSGDYCNRTNSAISKTISFFGIIFVTLLM